MQREDLLDDAAGRQLRDCAAGAGGEVWGCCCPPPTPPQVPNMCPQPGPAQGALGQGSREGWAWGDGATAGPCAQPWSWHGVRTVCPLSPCLSPCPWGPSGGQTWYGWDVGRWLGGWGGPCRAVLTDGLPLEEVDVVQRLALLGAQVLQPVPDDVLPFLRHRSGVSPAPSAPPVTPASPCTSPPQPLPSPVPSGLSSPHLGGV